VVMNAARPGGAARGAHPARGTRDRGELALHASSLRRAVRNVVHNALEAMPQGGTRILEGVRTTTAVQLRVGDGGTGIPAARLARICEPLYTTKPGGLAWAGILCRRP
jgi:signal transduction histidine kinase